MAAGSRLDILALGLLLALCIGARLAFYGVVPPMLNPDSAGYYVPARNLVYGDGFELGLRRTPTYPLFLAGVISFVGEDLQKIVTVQHVIFGPLLVLLTYALGRLTTGRLASLLAATLVAISGPLLLYEHYVMTEIPFGILLLALLCSLLLLVKRASLRWAAASGLLFGLLVLCRPSGQILAPLALGMLLLLPGGWRRRAAAAGLFAALALVAVVPWMAYNKATQGQFVIAGGGRFLLARTLKMDPGGFTFERPAGVVEDERTTAARNIVQEEAAKRRPGSVAQRFRDDLGLTDAEAYPLMQSFAIEAIRNRPVYFATSSVEAFVEIMVGEPINIRREGVPVADADFERRARAALRAPIYKLDANRAQAILSVYDPSRWGAAVPLLFLVGVVVAAAVPGQRWLLLPALATLALIGGSATLVGGELRYRFPQDPLIALVSVSGLVSLGTLALARLRPAARSSEPATRPSATHRPAAEPGHAPAEPAR
ncbi:MAG: glycosyltransferase family 39 protein [Chloroflexi bacterium]|nr:glycosyltransferase family 39 protein [Chloroflexota bacterium]